jgi:hypothetical protein
LPVATSSTRWPARRSTDSQKILGDDLERDPDHGEIAGAPGGLLLALIDS